jgi:hypothetical protein
MAGEVSLGHARNRYTGLKVMKTAINYLLKQLTEDDMAAFHQWKADDAGCDLSAFLADAAIDLAEAIESLHFAIVSHEKNQRKLAAVDQLAQALKEIQG